MDDLKSLGLQLKKEYSNVSFAWYIFTYALLVLDDYMKDHKTVNESKYRWFLGGRKRTEGMNLPKQH